MSNEKNEKGAQINIRIDDDLKTEAKRLAKQEGRSLSNWIVRSIEKRVKKANKQKK
ncbi:MAG: hypothetical protein ISR69_15580 [Gammaproteobacteria bacterium]|nr:hypothetical protein [Gammaproteobacteria bacterium]